MTFGMGAQARFRAIQEVNTRTPRKFDPPRNDQGKRLKISDFFGINTFDLKKMKERLSQEVFSQLSSAVESGKTLEPHIAESVAQAIKEWALMRGVTHFCHWFQPQTGSTAEKHDAFISFDADHRLIEKFTGSQLIQSEPDASSFPSGGMRTTFEARGYTAWDPSSPMFIMEHLNGKTLCIPSVFISYHGNSLDEKTGLLRSIEALSKKACELLNLLGEAPVHRITPTLGIEQEYFLVDRAFSSLRPDLTMTGRTLIGSEPPKGQQLEDHYFGSIPARVQAFMTEVEFELYKLGIPIKTRHNEVAPCQFECAPIFEEANLAIDHNQLTMEILRKVAVRHHFNVLLHEKPFAGVNGSGKHNNWSLMIPTQKGRTEAENLLDPGNTPHQNLRFLIVLIGILKGVNKHSGLLRAGIASSGNDHRLGANEAPPAIISVFLGDMLSRILNDLETGSTKGGSAEATVLELGVSSLPHIMKDNTDRNRTSPLAFTGNKFEFRAVGSSASAAFPITLLNSAVADGFHDLIEAIKKEKDILKVIREGIKETKAIRFEGNNYSAEWVVEAEKRGLPHHKKTPDALLELVKPQAQKLLSSLGVFSQAEIQSRFHVRLERYLKNTQIEIETLRSLVDTCVLPAAFAYYGLLCEGIQLARQSQLDAPQMEVAGRLSKCIIQLQEGRRYLEELIQKAEQAESEENKAKIVADQVSAATAEIRQLSDLIEAIVADDLWPLPKYREMLFIS